jgi:uncharacterized protein (TIGR02266 family)
VADPVITARTARESLARGLNALQSDPNVPPHLLELAGPIAQAMGALFQIERSAGAQLVPHADIALTNTRAALSQLQAQPAQHPAVLSAMEAVASSLAHVHALSKLAASGAQPQGGFIPQGAPPPTGGPSFVAGPTVAAAPAPGAFPAANRAAFKPGSQPPPAGSPLAATYAAGAAGGGRPMTQPSPQAQPPQRPQNSQKPPAAPMPAGDVPIISADLGTHSPTNFYKGLSGNDIIDHGGLFVSTYMVPKIGTAVRLKVSLPGGYEFEANAVVKWSREQSDAADAPPGFGAQFTQITPEARQLVYRYVRNREPLFHDDL